MDTYYLIGACIAVYALLGQLVMLGIQIAAYRRHGHKSFLVLCIASVIALIYCILAGLPYLIPLEMPVLVMLTAAGAVIGASGALLGLWGTVLLFKSYRNLAEAVARSSPGGA